MTKPPADRIDERLALLQSPGFGAAKSLAPADPLDPTPMLVPIERIRPYDHNPRTVVNAAYEQIKDSIRQRGYRGVLPITRRPGENDYMVAEGGNTALQIVKELFAETQDPQYATLQCLFEPWISESETLIAHLVENDSRGELVFIDRARAAHELRRLLEAEAQVHLSYRELASRLKARGYRVDPTALSRMDYAIDELYPCLPQAFRAGLGQSQVEKVKRIESNLLTYLKSRQQSAQIIDEAKQWYLGCLARNDSSTLPFNFEALQSEIEIYLAELCQESAARVRADLLLIDRTGSPGQEAPSPEPFTPKVVPPKRQTPPSLHPVALDPAEDENERDEVPECSDTTLQPSHTTEAANTSSQFSSNRPVTNQGPTASTAQLPQDVKSLRARLWTLATQLAQTYQFGDCIAICKQGCGFTVDLPQVPLFAEEAPSSATEAERVTLWWMLAALADQWPYGPDEAPALHVLDNARIAPAIQAAASEDHAALTAMLDPLVGFPPSLDIAARQLLAVLAERDYQRLLQMIETRRRLQDHCRRLGKPSVWSL